jgi:MFS transporter, DHA2 family, multidrug resistance protein
MTPDSPPPQDPSVAAREDATTAPAGSRSGDVEGHPRRWPILGVLVTSLLVVVLDNTVLNVALKTIQLDLGSTQEQLLWAINAYTLVFAALLFSWGVMGDRYGRKRILVIGLVLFGLASALSAFSQTPTQLIAFRALMGVGGAAVMPATLAIIIVVFPPKERGKAIGLWAASVGAAVAIGPILAGVLLEHFWWGSVFLINIPIVVVGVAGILALVPESKNPKPGRLDPLGVLLSMSSLGLLVYGIIHGGDTQDWLSVSVLGSILLGLALLAVWVTVEVRSDHPSLDVKLFRNRGFTVPLAAVSLAFFALSGVTFFLAFFLQFVRGYSPLQAGLCFVPFAAGQLLGAPRSAKMVARFGARAVITAGLAIVTLSMLAYPFIGTDTTLWLLLPVFFAFGYGMGNTIAPSTTQMTLALPPSEAGAGAAVQNTVRQVWGALGVATLGSLLATVYANGMADAPAVGKLPAGVGAVATDSIGATQEVASRVAASGVPGADVLAAALRTAGDDAFVHAMHVTSLVGAAVLGMAATVVVTLLPHSRGTESTFHQAAGGEQPAGQGEGQTP